MKSWKTSIGGLASIVTAAILLLRLMDSGVIDAETLTPILAFFGIGGGLMSARDNNVTSEDAGAKKSGR